jgi:hypothetical protein
MSLKFQVFLIFSLFSPLNFFLILNNENFSLLRNFTCAVVKDELEKNLEMRTIFVIEQENKFPKDFSREILKCLPKDVAVLLSQTDLYKKHSIILPKESMVIYVVDKVEKV